MRSLELLLLGKGGRLRKTLLRETKCQGLSSCALGTFLLFDLRERSLATEVGTEKPASSRGFLQRACHGDGH